MKSKRENAVNKNSSFIPYVESDRAKVLRIKGSNQNEADQNMEKPNGLKRQIQLGTTYVGDSVEKIGKKIQKKGYKKVGKAIEKLGNRVEHIEI
jgi:hypothetical protein